MAEANAKARRCFILFLRLPSTDVAQLYAFDALRGARIGLDVHDYPTDYTRTLGDLKFFGHERLEFAQDYPFVHPDYGFLRAAHSYV
jgi:hypothetical protein